MIKKQPAPLVETKTNNNNNNDNNNDDNNKSKRQRGAGGEEREENEGKEWRTKEEGVHEWGANSTGNGYQNCACHYNFKVDFPRFWLDCRLTAGGAGRPEETANEEDK